MLYLKLALCFVVAYLLGSVSFAIVISKTVYKKDIRTFGSGNAGMTNMLRTFGKGAAAATLAGDFLKGVFSVMLARFIMQNISLGAAVEITPMVMDIAVYCGVGGALLGHLKPVYFGFKGGKGISVIFGCMMAATPVVTFSAFIVWIVVMAISRMVSLASIIAVLSYSVITLIMIKITGVYSVPNLIAAVVYSSVIIYAHRSNIKRLLNGTEYKFGQKK